MSIQRPLLEERFEEVSVAERGPEQVTELEHSSFNVTENAAGEAYNEQAFRYFLEIERHRSELSGRPFLLLLVDLKRDFVSELEPLIHAHTARQLFSALTRCLRDTDFLGWYREQRTIGAVLTQDTPSAGAGLSDLVAGRVTNGLRQQLPVSLSGRLHLRVYQLPSSTARQSQP
jgi:hypothetical protein